MMNGILRIGKTLLEIYVSIVKVEVPVPKIIFGTGCRKADN